ncbi:hypothetical protein SKAU_G00347490 [Synaphobranchus kaupii]|uniref:VLIG-type G domain-containing protein n=1 Tax=Synaphobranchus kaupii TaxID=118154 RepID=A0A9Q1EJU0_SYNKA|nr:hypothetical protein SKAU_G00347490 [Synaphobranchus kaupii]
MESEASAPFGAGIQSGSDVIRNASGGLGLRGIFLSKDLQELSKERKTVLEVPENVVLLSASKPPQDLMWITDVLEEIGRIVGKESRLLVVTVLGLQSTGKSTLLNTMFGLQFAVSSGRCTRGAFMQLLQVKGDLKEKLRCDFLMVIDTEGLKAQELAQLDDSNEHDNELATLVTGLSDLTLVNVSTENSIEMEDTLQIVVHAFIRMREVGKRPNCQFIHQNAGDVAVHEKNARDRMYFLNKLNEMTKAAARMEDTERNYSSFGDVMEYDSSESNWYIGSLWHGNLPMAAVSTGYSKNILDLKKHIFDCLEQRQHKPGTIHDFGEWLKNIWAAVKKENFIFSFKNSLVAEAYSQLSLQHCDWEWELKEFLEKTIEDEIGTWDVEKSITKPTEELIKSLLNCKKQCPFCGVPCEQAGLNHSNHFSEYHMPDGLSGYANCVSEKLSTDICTISVTSGETFKNEDTDYKSVQYKNYKSVNDFYKSWQIQPDCSYKASSYWKSVFYRFNRDFAQKYGYEPADIPNGWNISKEQVRKDLQEAYQVSLNSVY